MPPPTASQYEPQRKSESDRCGRSVGHAARGAAAAADVLFVAGLLLFHLTQRWRVVGRRCVAIFEDRVVVGLDPERIGPTRIVARGWARRRGGRRIGGVG